MEKFCVVIYLFSLLSIVRMDIAFPAEDLVPVNNQNKDDRVPVYVPGRCPPNQLYYPGDQKTDWVCDCAPSFVYYPPDDMCHEVYRQGPCNKSDYLILKKTEIIPSCIRNPCINDTMVPFNGKCEKLYTKNGCPVLHDGGGTLAVNTSSLELQCLPGNPVELHFINVPPYDCPPGSKRKVNGSTGGCRKVIST